MMLMVQFVETESMTGKWLKVLASSSAAAIDSRTAGLAIEGSQPSDLPRSGQWLLLPAMMIGAWAAGTAGGIKINTFMGLGRGIGQGLRGGSIGRPVALAAVWVGVYLGLVFLFFLMMLWAEAEMAGGQLPFFKLHVLRHSGAFGQPRAKIRARARR